MTPESKQAVLTAFDALNRIASGKGFGRRHSHGGSAVCDNCEHSLASGGVHPTTCFVGAALAALQPIVPRFDEREAWIQQKESA